MLHGDHEHLDDGQRPAGLHGGAHGQRLQADPGTKLAANGQWVQVHFTATADCPTGPHEFRTAAWKNTSPETGQGDIFQLSPGTVHPTLTVLSANTAPTIAAGSATVTVNEGQTATNSGTWADANLTDTVTLSASVGTVTKSGTQRRGDVELVIRDDGRTGSDAGRHDHRERRDDLVEHDVPAQREQRRSDRDLQRAGVGERGLEHQAVADLAE